MNQDPKRRIRIQEQTGEILDRLPSAGLKPLAEINKSIEMSLTCENCFRNIEKKNTNTTTRRSLLSPGFGVCLSTVVM